MAKPKVPMTGFVKIDIPLDPPTPVDDYYARTHGEAIKADDEKPVLAARCIRPDGVADRGLDEVFPGQCLFLPLGGEYRYRVAISPLNLTGHPVEVTYRWESDKETELAMSENGKEFRRLGRGVYTTISNRAITLTIQKKK